MVFYFEVIVFSEAILEDIAFCLFGYLKRIASVTAYDQKSVAGNFLNKINEGLFVILISWEIIRMVPINAREDDRLRHIEVEFSLVFIGFNNHKLALTDESRAPPLPHKCSD